MNSKTNQIGDDVKKPPYWTDVYAVGTKDGDDEYEFFVALSRDPLVWRTTYQIAKTSGLSEKRVEEILDKYLRMGLVFAHEREDNKWAYWERVPDRLERVVKPLHLKDQDDRINKHMKKEGLMADAMHVYRLARDPKPAPAQGKIINGLFLTW